jgi:hypothetical protein
MRNWDGTRLRTGFSTAGDAETAGTGKTEAYGCPLAGGALNLNLGAVSLHRPVDHRETQTRATLALRRKERLEATAPCVLVHTHARIGDLENHSRQRSGGAGAGPPVARGPKRERSPLGHGIDRVQDKVRQRLANLTSDTRDEGQVRLQIGLDVDDDTPLLGHVAPARAREIDHFLNQVVQVTGASAGCVSRGR